jgi:hypothetical protein
MNNKPKINTDHVCRKNNFLVSPFMQRILVMVSEEAGRNANNQARASHGIQVLVLRYARDVKKINTDKLYNIKH